MSVEPQALERSVLERKERDELAAIAEAMGVKAGSRASKATLIDHILREAGIESGDDKPKRSRATKADAPANDKVATKADAGLEKTDASETANGQQSSADTPAEAAAEPGSAQYSKDQQSKDQSGARTDERPSRDRGPQQPAGGRG